MPHFPKPFYKKTRGLWYVQIDNKQINLGSNEEDAFQQYHKLMSQPQSLQVSTESLVTIIDAFLEWTQKNRAPDTYEWYRHRLQRFVTTYPEMRVTTLKPHHVEQWVSAYNIAQTTRRNYFQCIKRCLAWAKRQGRIDANPLEALDVPGAERKEVYIPPAEFERLLKLVKDSHFRDLLITTYQTGCRPQESLRLLAEYVDMKNSRWVFPTSKSKGKKSPRIIYLNDTALEITERLLAVHPTGVLFRNSAGDAWKTDSVNCCFYRIQMQIGRAIMSDQSQEPTAEEVQDFAATLSPMKSVKGVNAGRPKRSYARNQNAS